MMDEKEIEETWNNLRKSFRDIIESLHTRIANLEKAIATLNTQDERLLKLIAGFHDIDLDEIRGLEPKVKKE